MKPDANKAYVCIFHNINLLSNGINSYYFSHMNENAQNETLRDYTGYLGALLSADIYITLYTCRLIT